MHQCQQENLAGHRHRVAALGPYSRSGQVHRFGYLLEVLGLGRS